MVVLPTIVMAHLYNKANRADTLQKPTIWTYLVPVVIAILVILVPLAPIIVSNYLIITIMVGVADGSIDPLLIEGDASNCKDRYRYIQSNICNYTIYAIEQENASLCEKILEEREKRICYHNLAVIKMNASFCNKIEDNAFKDYCFAVVKKDASLCKKIEDVGDQYVCIQRVNYLIKNTRR